MSFDPPIPESALDAASVWLARRDRGLTPGEQDTYLQWLHEDPLHGRAVAHLEKTWLKLDSLAALRPENAARPDPDLLTGPARSPAQASWVRASASSDTKRGRGQVIPMRFVWMAAAAAVVLGVTALALRNQFSAGRSSPDANSKAVASDRVEKQPQTEAPRFTRQVLDDGSVVELRDGSRIASGFTARERRVRLLQGEAHFTVAKNPERPFIVEAGTVSVRDVDTAFDVMRADASVEVLVTDGKVFVERPALTTATPLEKGDRAVVDTRTAKALPVVTRLAPADADRALAWRTKQLEIVERPLSEVVAEFNRHNRQQIVIGDERAGQLRANLDNFHPDNVDGFVRLLEKSFDLTSERQADGTIVLHSAK